MALIQSERNFTTIEIPKELHWQLKKLACEEGLPVKQLVIKYLTSMLSKAITLEKK